MIRAVAHVAAMAPYALADVAAPGMRSLAQNESAFPPNPAALAAGRKAAGEAMLYPDPDWTDLRAAIGEIHSVAPDGILIGAGSMELIGGLMRGFSGPGDAVLGSAHGYLFAATACQQAGASYRTAPEQNFTVSVDNLLAAVTPDIRIVFVCNPGNPTGTSIPNAEIVRLRESLPENVLLIVDQAYGEFDGQDAGPIFELVERGDTVVLRTLSKAYCLAGARAGWGLFPKAIGSEVRKLLNPNNVSIVSQTMAIGAIRNQAHMAQTVNATAAIRERFSARLRAGGYPVPSSRTNFILIPFPTAEAARRADDALRKAGYLLRGLAGYGLPHCLRATIAEGEVMDDVADILIAFKELPHG
ncbi:MAG: pyridoxal phosphate-dependent aminotransferase [Geminicoccaceae bacterium]